jgi:acyl-CoA reductase-like NAD-dependent aldehyde dehydrogenase
VTSSAGEADAVRIANDAIYGLHRTVYTNDVDRAREVAGQIRTGGHRAQRGCVVALGRHALTCGQRLLNPCQREAGK